MDGIDVPPFFICPISLEFMKDPVTVSTGITYDRESIEKWLFSGKNSTTCPVTKQVISDCELTPNHTLRRLIQSWCLLNASHGIERIPTPKPPISRPQIIKLLDEAKSPLQQMKCLKRLQSIASQNVTNRRCIESSGVVELLASIVSNSDSTAAEEVRPIDEALSILYSLQLSEAGLKNLMGKNGDFIVSLTRVMHIGSYESRVYAVLLMKSMLEIAGPMQLIGLRPELFFELVRVLCDQISQQASKAALQILVHICPRGRNKIKAAEAGVVPILIDLLLDSSEKRVCEMILTVLDAVCGCAEGRSELLSHGAGLAIVSKKILRVSQVASERAVRILLSISKFCAAINVLQEMLQLGVVAKLCLVLQLDCGSKTKERAREVLKLHARVWKNSPCIPTNLSSTYPA
ncbi:E3 ubiquitin-protein ligase PUB22 [Hibiscus syriacus]|uniref:U-box domain-containing protein n=1 Tax=Hibiscus syriacus TaxID=106335 RepID=A0A6A3CVE4_HIBSY|nr:E3 ubiquitin-protein ligase PUB23-like [Hibiscus syriacus]KAE8731131.1 E3 ubiquitin-protein ligase PUB22 [Hibiscus syriacus]